MTDINDLRRKARAARSVHVQVGAASFTLLLPTEHEVEVEALRTRVHDPESAAARTTRLTRALLERSIVEWSGVKAEQLAPGAGDELAELVPGAAELLLDNDLQTAQLLLQSFLDAFNRRKTSREEAEKN